MQITDIKVRKLNLEGRMRAVVSLTFDDSFVIHDIKVIQGQEKLFVAMPSRRTPDGEFKDIVHPINTETRREIENAILAEYDKIADEPAPATVDTPVESTTELTTAVAVEKEDE